MLYISTRDNSKKITSAEAIARGISSEGGLFVPESFPKYDGVTFEALLLMDYRGRAKKVIGDYLTDFTAEEISDCVEKAYTEEKFGGSNPAPISIVNHGDKKLCLCE